MNKKKTISEEQKDLIEEFSFFDDWQDKYEHIIDMGKKLNMLPDKYHINEFKVEGCASEVYLVPKKNNNILNFQADSNSVITRGLIAMLLRIYSDRAPKDIINNPPEFIDRVGLGIHLTPSRTNGLHSMVKKIMAYAKEYSK
jgi:cysteine desulfuration protein SufE